MLTKQKIFRPFVIAILLILLAEVLISWTPLDNFFDNQIENSLKDKQKELASYTDKGIDVICLGTSQTNDNLVTTEFEKLIPGNLNVYNFGLLSGDYYLFKLLLENYITRYGKPKLILLEVNEILFSKDYFSSLNSLYFITFLKQHPERLDALFITPHIPIKGKLEMLFSLLSGMYRYRSLLEYHKLRSLLHEKKRVSKTVYFKGWSPLPVKPIMSDPKAMDQYIREKKEEILNGYEQGDSAKFHLLLTYCKQQDIPVVLIQWPNHPKYNDVIQKTTFYPYYKQVTEELSKQYGYPIIDLTQSVPEDISKFYSDPRHLSQEGAVWYTRKLSHYFSHSPQSESIAKQSNE
jgi:hypothetical protein